MTIDDVRTDGLEEFQAQRGRMFGIAYRMLGSASDAEDVLQDAWLRWQGADRNRVADVPAFLAKVVTNLCLNALDSARSRREVYPGPWLPEPIFTGPETGDELGPLETTAQRDTVSIALLTLLERLTPAERAAYVLREAFAYSNREVAELIGTSEVNARQLHARARRHLGEERRERPANPEQWRELVSAFLLAAVEGDLTTLESLLAADAVSHADGGGIVSAARKPIFGAEKIARYIAGLVERYGTGLVPGVAEVNGEPAFIAMQGEELQSVWFLHIENGRIHALDLIPNPQKLAFAQGQLSRFSELPGLSR